MRNAILRNHVHVGTVNACRAILWLRSSICSSYVALTVPTLPLCSRSVFRYVIRCGTTVTASRRVLKQS